MAPATSLPGMIPPARTSRAASVAWAAGRESVPLARTSPSSRPRRPASVAGSATPASRAKAWTAPRSSMRSRVLPPRSSSRPSEGRTVHARFPRATCPRAPMPGGVRATRRRVSRSRQSRLEARDRLRPVAARSTHPRRAPTAHRQPRGFQALSGRRRPIPGSPGGSATRSPGCAPRHRGRHRSSARADDSSRRRPPARRRRWRERRPAASADRVPTPRGGQPRPPRRLPT